MPRVRRSPERRVVTCLTKRLRNRVQLFSNLSGLISSLARGYNKGWSRICAFGLQSLSTDTDFLGASARRALALSSLLAPLRHSSPLCLSGRHASDLGTQSTKAVLLELAKARRQVKTVVGRFTHTVSLFSLSRQTRRHALHAVYYYYTHVSLPIS